MPPVRFDIWWSETDHKTFKVDSEQLVGDVAAEIRVQLVDYLPESDQHNRVIEYVLFKSSQASREPLLARKQTFSQVHVADGDTLYLANLQAPWWVKRGRSTAGQAVVPPAPSPRRCLLQFGGSVVEVPSEGIHLSRSYLLNALPSHVVVRENAKSFAGLKSRLHAVSRQQHCVILRQDDHWLLRAYNDTYVNGRALTTGMTTPLSGSTTIVLGHDGWPVEVRLISA